VLEAEALPERAAAAEAAVRARLEAWPGRHPAVQEVRGRGLLWGVEMASAADARALVAGAMARGVLLLAGGPEGRVAQVVPPLTIAPRRLAAALDTVEEALSGRRGGARA